MWNVVAAADVQTTDAEIDSLQPVLDGAVVSWTDKSSVGLAERPAAAAAFAAPVTIASPAKPNGIYRLVKESNPTSRGDRVANRERSAQKTTGRENTERQGTKRAKRAQAEATEEVQLPQK